MKDSDTTNLKQSQEAEEQNGNKSEGKEKSRGKRRTAREIAQMFEQLKLRHSARKQEWQIEKQELLKQASLAEESKNLLIELKGILEDVKSQLSSEENRRKKIETEFNEAKNEWKIEKESLLKIIAKLESKHFTELGNDKKVIEELENVKVRLSTNEKKLAAVQKSNIEKQRSLMEMRRSFEKEKKKLIKDYKGEKRNWEKAKQVMVEKIEALQEELKKSTTDSFLLHGKHVGSPLDDAITGLTSPDTDEMFAHDEKEQRDNFSEQIKDLETDTSTSINDKENCGGYQQTVEEALNQIERITQDLERIGSANHSRRDRVDIASQQSLDITSPGISTGSTQSISLKTFPYQNQRLTKITSKDSASFPSQQSQSNRTHSPSFEPKEILEKLYLNKNKSLSNALSNSSQFEETSNDTSYFKKSFLLESNDNSLSPSSCSILTFTESSAESPQGQVLCSPKKSSVTSSSKSTIGSKTFEVFAKDEKENSARSEKLNEQKPRKALPNLHQQLLFGTIPKQLKSQNRFINQKEKILSNEFVSNHPTLKKFENSSSGFFSNKSNQPHLGSPDFVEDTQNITQSIKTNHKDLMGDVTNPPPVRPKPSITIEKDTQGNILRVISDPTYRFQESPRNHTFESSQEKAELKNRRRRSEEVINELEPLALNEHLVANTPQKEEAKSLVDKQVTQNHDEEVKGQEKESFGSKGKTWIRKHLSFLEGSPRSDNAMSMVAKVNQSAKRRSRTKTNPIPSRSCEEHKKSIDILSSDDSDRFLYWGKSRLQSNIPDKESKKSKGKRYTRSKTESSVDVKNLLHKFKTSQFKSKKPSIVKEFEKKLLENEVKTLDEDLKTKTIQRDLEERTRNTKTIRDKAVNDDDGYSGEDELEQSFQIKSRRSNTQEKTSLFRSSSIRSLQEQMELRTENVNNFSRHQSLMDLSSFDISDDHLKINQFTPARICSSHFDKNELTARRSPQRAVQHVKTSFSRSPEVTHPSQDSSNQISSTSLEQFDRTTHNRLSSPLRNRFLTKTKKRLSWASSLHESIEENVKNYQSENTWRKPNMKPNTLSTSFRGILLKPNREGVTHGILTTSSEKENSNKIIESNKLKHQISKKLQKKAENLEKVLKKGPSVTRMRRYQRSKTLPIQQLATSEESDSQSEEEVYAKENLPILTLQFKKPAPASRRLPSRWKKCTK